MKRSKPRIVRKKEGNDIPASLQLVEISQRTDKPFAQKPLSHRRTAAVHNRKQRRGFVDVFLGFLGRKKFKIPERRGVHKKRGRIEKRRQRRNMSHSPKLRFLKIPQNGAGASGFRRRVADSENGKRRNPEEALQPPCGVTGRKVLRVTRHEKSTAKRRGQISGLNARVVQDFSRIEGVDFGKGDCCGKRSRFEASGIDVQKGDGECCPAPGKSRKARVRVGLLREQRAWRNDPDHSSVDKRFAVRRRHLFADGDLFACADELFQIRSDRMIRHARHRNRTIRVPACQRDIQNP